MKTSTISKVMNDPKASKAAKAAAASGLAQKTKSAASTAAPVVNPRPSTATHGGAWDSEFRVAARYLADGIVDVDVVVAEFSMTKLALARTLGFAEDTFQRHSRVTAPKTQQRLREFLEIITRVEHWAGGTLQAMAWYRGQGIPALGDQTAEALVKQDKAGVVRTYLDSYAVGGYA